MIRYSLATIRGCSPLQDALYPDLRGRNNILIPRKYVVPMISAKNEKMKAFMAKASSVIRRHTDNQEFIEDFPSYALIDRLSGNVRPWRYVLVDFFRDKQGRFVTLEDGNKIRRPKHNGTLHCIDSIPDIEDISINIDMQVFLSEFKEAALSNVGNKQMREVLEMYYWGYMSLQQISETKALTESRVSQILKKAIKKLKNSEQIKAFNI